MFFISLIILNSTVEPFSKIYNRLFLFPISYAGYGLLKIQGFTLRFRDINGAEVFEYQLSHYRLIVTFGCIGIFAFFILISGIQF